MARDRRSSPQHPPTSSRATAPTDGYIAFAAEIAERPDLLARLLHDHTPTADGWCRAHGHHSERHPCSIRRLAELAEQRAARPDDPS